MKAPSEDPHGHEAQAIEAAALRELHEAADGTLRDRLGLYRHEGGGTLVSVAAGDPSILINRTTGLGVSGPATRQLVDEIVSCYRDAGVARFFVQRHPQALPPELADWLAAAGLEPQRDWIKFRHDLAALPEGAGDLSPEPVDAAHLRLARDKGCRAVYTTTGAAVPGEPQHSGNNILRAGFRELYRSANHAPPRPG